MLASTSANQNAGFTIECEENITNHYFIYRELHKMIVFDTFKKIWMHREKNTKNRLGRYGLSVKEVESLFHLEKS